MNPDLGMKMKEVGQTRAIVMDPEVQVLVTYPNGETEVSFHTDHAEHGRLCGTLVTRQTQQQVLATLDGIPVIVADLDDDVVRSQSGHPYRRLRGTIRDFSGMTEEQIAAAIHIGSEPASGAASKPAGRPLLPLPPRRKPRPPEMY